MVATRAGSAPRHTYNQSHARTRVDYTRVHVPCSDNVHPHMQGVQARRLCRFAYDVYARTRVTTISICPTTESKRVNSPHGPSDVQRAGVLSTQHGCVSSSDVISRKLTPGDRLNYPYRCVCMWLCVCVCVAIHRLSAVTGPVVDSTAPITHLYSPSSRVHIVRIKSERTDERTNKRNTCTRASSRHNVRQIKRDGQGAVVYVKILLSLLRMEMKRNMKETPLK